MARPFFFRATALNRLSSPEQLDERLQIVPPRTWFAFAALAVLLLVAGAWSLCAHLPLHVAGEGVFQAARPGAPREITVFIPATDIPQVRAGQPVQVRIPGSDSAVGEVVAIARETTSRAQLLQVLDHAATVDRLTRQGPVVKAVVTLRDQVDVPAGQRCTVELVVGEARPARLLFGL